MKHLFFIYIVVYSISLNAQTTQDKKFLTFMNYTIKGHDNLRYVDKSLNYEKYRGLYDIHGNEIIPCEYLELYCYKNGISAKNKEGKWGVLSYNGDVILDVVYSTFVGCNDDEHVCLINLGGIPVKTNSCNAVGGKWGAANGLGKIIVPCIYDGIRDAQERLFAINQGGKSKDGTPSNIEGGKWGLYGEGREILPCIYDEPPIFKNSVAMLKKDGEIKLIKNPLKDKNQIQIAGNNVAFKKKKNNGPAVSRYPAPNSDVDKDIPTGQQRKENTFAFIIANENYPDAPVPYSLNDGRIFKEYCSKTLGIPEKNINLYEDATFGTIIAAVEKMKSIADAYDGEASVIFYYAGHGFPDEKQGTAYLLPIDGNASDITTTGYSLAKLYKDLASLKLKSSVVFLDACFSGAKREDNMLASSRGVAIKVKEEAPTGNMVVFSAAQGDETAHQLEEKGHGLFTYYLLKELQQTNGDVTLGELSEFVTKQVKRQSVVINNKKQTPTVIPSQAVVNSWQSMKLK